ncbi:hypothetical protein [Methanooceanicella nereidis]|uniref:hypothetical protein n=1 Tax=Methanooceanicella nereidis TaxID=2052831 RepID=UPI001E2ED1AC|nr:hypothetical protein [Methanocella sp. CWC-04]
MIMDDIMKKDKPFINKKNKKSAQVSEIHCINTKCIYKYEIKNGEIISEKKIQLSG